MTSEELAAHIKAARTALEILAQYAETRRSEELRKWADGERPTDADMYPPGLANIAMHHADDAARRVIAYAETIERLSSL